MTESAATTRVPLGTVSVNLLGAFLMGFAGGPDLDPTMSHAVLGFLGGFTTFSTWMSETVYLGLVPRPRPPAIVNLAAVLVLGIGLAAGGRALSMILWG